MDYKLSIKASSEEEFKTLKQAYEKFDEHYSLKGKLLGTIEIRKFVVGEYMVQIYPEDKNSKINEIVRKKKELGGLLKSTSEFSLIELDNVLYDINYQNPDFKKE